MRFARPLILAATLVLVACSKAPPVTAPTPAPPPAAATPAPPASFAADPCGEASLDRLEHIVDGRLDARYLDLTAALLAEIPGERARELERRLATRRGPAPEG